MEFLREVAEAAGHAGLDSDALEGDERVAVRLEAGLGLAELRQDVAEVDQCCRLLFGVPDAPCEGERFLERAPRLRDGVRVVSGSVLLSPAEDAQRHRQPRRILAPLEK